MENGTEKVKFLNITVYEKFDEESDAEMRATGSAPEETKEFLWFKGLGLELMKPISVKGWGTWGECLDWLNECGRYDSKFDTPLILVSVKVDKDGLDEKDDTHYLLVAFYGGSLYPSRRTSKILSIVGRYDVVFTDFQAFKGYMENLKKGQYCFYDLG